MPKIAFTDLAVRSLKPGEYFDTRTPAFGMRVGKNRRTWIVMRGRERLRTRIGHYPQLGLAEARKRALVLLGSTPEKLEAMTWAEARELFLETYASQHQKPKTLAETQRLLTKHFKALDRKPLSSISTGQISAILDGLLETPSEALHAFKAARTFGRWAKKRGLWENPVTMDAPAKEATRERVLTPDELRAIYTEATGTFGDIVRLLILTGQRRSEIGSLRWDYIDFEQKVISLPPEATKNGRHHTFPIGERAIALLKSRPRTSDYVFPARHGGAFSGYSASKEHLDDLCGVENWTLHDLRRTWASMNAEWALPHVLERYLNHVSGTISGVAAIYNRFAYEKELRQCCTQWEARLSAILSVQSQHGERPRIRRPEEAPAAL